MSDETSAVDIQEIVPVCAIGTSAGGVSALQTLFAALPDDLGLAYVVAMHFSPDQPSILHELISRSTAMPVAQVDELAKLRPDHVYVIAPDRELVISGSEVVARHFPDKTSIRAPIDTLFSSLASEENEGIAVVMTGVGQDGTAGVRAVKENGGIVVAQDPGDAEFPGMPQSVIETGAADFIEPLALMSIRIAELARNRRSLTAIDEDQASDEVQRIIAIANTRTGHDFSRYKISTVVRRIKRRAHICQCASIASYLVYTEENHTESKYLFRDMLISVTSFFRDRGAFAALERTIDRIFLENGAGDLRIWAVGCASGEEAYSVGILMLEAAERRKSRRQIQLFATDLDEEALAKARVGIYPRSIEHEVSADRLERYFVDEVEHYRVCRQLRDMVLFAAHSVTRDPPFTQINLIVCRNVTIYFGRHLQQQVSATLHYALKAGGYLFLGPAELPDLSEGLYDVVDREARIYRASPRKSSILPPFSKNILNLADIPPHSLNRVITGELLNTAHLAALEEHAPPSVLIDPEGRILYLSPRAGRFMLLPGGPLSDSLLTLIRPELKGELMIALDGLRKATTIVGRPVQVSIGDEKRMVFIYAAKPAAVPGTSDRALICFIDGGASPDSLDAMEETKQEEVRQLYLDLNAANRAAATSRAEHDTALLDLRIANEELHSLNEEYRATAEELETSKEEIQSVNEELHTVNEELKRKVHVISSAHNDLLNLTSSSEIGTLFLDRDLKIRIFTPPISDFFNISDVDVGRSITDFAYKFDYRDLENEIRTVLREQTPLEEEIRNPQRRWLLLRIRPYKTTDGSIGGVVVTFNDITARKQEIALQESEARFKAFVKAGHDVVYRLNADWSQMIQLEGRDILADTLEPSLDWMDTYILPEDQARVRTTIERAIEDKDIFDLEHRVRRRDGSPGWTRSRAVPVLDTDGEIVEWIGTAIDVTDSHAGVAQRRDEDRHRIDIVPSLLWETDPTGRLSFANDQWRAYTGLNVAQLQLWSWIDTFHPSEREEARAAFEQAFANGMPFHREQRIRASDGNYRRFLVRLAPLGEVAGRITHWYGAAMDIEYPRPVGAGEDDD